MIYELCPDESLNDQWLFYADDEDGRLVVRDEYTELACRRCGKFDEGRAIEIGVSPAFRCETDRDLVATSEDWLCMSRGLREHLDAHGYGGLGYAPIPHSDHLIVYPTMLVETDETRAGFENHRRCGLCGRFSERVVGPMLAALKIPSVPTFFASTIQSENVKVVRHRIFADEAIVASLRSLRFLGIEFVVAH